MSALTFAHANGPTTFNAIACANTAHGTADIICDTNTTVFEVYNNDATKTIFVYSSNDNTNAVAKGRPILAGASWTHAAPLGSFWLFCKPAETAEARVTITTKTS